MLLGAVGCLTLIGLSDIGLFWDPDGIVAANDPFGAKAVVAASDVNRAAGRFLFAAAFLSFALMTVGYHARAATAAALFFSLVHASWNYLPLSGADAAMRCILFCLVWGDVGAVWSLDSWLSSRRGLPSRLEPPTSPIAALTLIRFQIALIYLSSGLWKLLNPLWRDGSALHYVLSSNAYHRFPVVLPPWSEPLLTAATYMTLMWEIGFPVMVLWHRTRLLALAVGLLIHAGIWIGLEIGLFSFVMVAGYAAYLDPEAVRDASSRLRRVLGVAVPYTSAAARVI
jgi:hypothetical protein